MKKIFKFVHPKIKIARLVDAARSDVRKYLIRERKKTLPESVDFWDFACKCGPNEKEAKVVHVTEISKCLGEVEEQQLESYYVEILAKPGYRTKKPE